MSFSIGYITLASKSDADDIARQVISERLAACSNCFPMTSQYRWNDEMQSDDEWVLILKTSNDRWDKLARRVEQLHPYDVPCIMRIEVSANEAYESWINSETKREQQP